MNKLSPVLHVFISIFPLNGTSTNHSNKNETEMNFINKLEPCTKGIILPFNK